MERAIARRESFVLRGLQKQSKTAAQVKANAQAQAKKNMAELSRKTKQMKAELGNFDSSIKNNSNFGRVRGKGGEWRKRWNGR